MNQPNWLIELAILLLSLLLSVFVAPPLQKWREKRILSSHSGTLVILRSEYERIKRFHNDPAVLQFETNHLAIRSLITILFSLLGGIMYYIVLLSTSPQFVINSILRSMVLLLVLAMVMSMLYSLILFNDVLLRVKNFERYEGHVVARIEELEKLVAKQEA